MTKPDSASGATAYDAIIFAVAHQEFIAQGADIVAQSSREGCLVYDLKGILEKDLAGMTL
jgi:UDP-N-acetyl-D-mannosaminuronate dehydrogenase